MFDVILFVLLAITTLFLQIYPNAEHTKTDMFIYTFLSLLFFIMSLIIIYFFVELSNGFKRDSKLFLLENNYNFLQEKIELQQQNSEQSRKIRHDILNHLSNVRALIYSGETGSAVALLDKTAQNIEHILPNRIINTGNKIVDAILLSKSSVCYGKNIIFEYSIEPLEGLNIDVVDLSSLISNLLDNAIEAAEQTAEPYVNIKIFKYNAYYTICVENSYKGKTNLKHNAEVLFTTKSLNGFHGYGTQIINEIAQKYNGNFLWDAGVNRFVTTVLLKMKSGQI